MMDDAWRRLPRERATRFWRRIAPDFRLAGNYLPGFLFFGMAALVLYVRLAERLAPGPWLPPACALPLAAAVARVRVRTWLQPADRLFLMPAEAALAGYFRRVLLAAWPGQLAVAGATGVAAWPLVRVQGDMPFASYGAVIAGLLLLKSANLPMWWREQQLADGRIRRLAALLRGLATWGAIWLGLAHGAAAQLCAGGLLYAALALVFRSAARHPLHWERLIALEERMLASWRRFLGQFVDAEEGKAAGRDHPLARLAGRAWLAPGQAYRYAYALIWLRSPLFGMTLRLTATGTVLAALADGLALKAGIAALFAVLLRIQLRELGRGEGAAMRELLLPLPEENRRKAARDIGRAAWVAGAVMLAIPAVLSAAG